MILDQVHHLYLTLNVPLSKKPFLTISIPWMCLRPRYSGHCLNNLLSGLLFVCLSPFLPHQNISSTNLVATGLSYTHGTQNSARHTVGAYKYLFSKSVYWRRGCVKSVILCDTFDTSCCVQVAFSNQKLNWYCLHQLFQLDNQIQEQEHFLSTLLPPKCFFAEVSFSEGKMSVLRGAIIMLPLHWSLVCSEQMV